jgi:hypothetical protein
MLAALGRTGADLSPEALASVFSRQLNRVRKLLAVGRFPVLYVSHRNCIEHPAGAAARVNAFLGGSLDERAMAAAVDPGLYRHRVGDVDAARRQT